VHIFIRKLHPPPLLGLGEISSIVICGKYEGGGIIERKNN
jgi:hypothetical protein